MWLGLREGDDPLNPETRAYLATAMLPLLLCDTLLNAIDPCLPAPTLNRAAARPDEDKKLQAVRLAVIGRNLLLTSHPASAEYALVA